MVGSSSGRVSEASCWHAPVQILVLGWSDYWVHSRNRFDFCVTALTVAVEATSLLDLFQGYNPFFIIMLRAVRMLRVLKVGPLTDRFPHERRDQRMSHKFFPLFLTSAM
jgi:hypothetical protein